MQETKKYNPITSLGMQILKSKQRISDGNTVILYSNPNNPNMWVLCHQDLNGNVINTRTYQWTSDKKIERLVKQSAMKDYNAWRKLLMLRFNDFEEAMIGLMDLLE